MRPIGTLRCLVPPFRGSKGLGPVNHQAMSDMESRFLLIDRTIANWDAALSSPLFRGSKGSVRSIIKAISDIEPRCLIIDRATANAPSTASAIAKIDRGLS